MSDNTGLGIGSNKTPIIPSVSAERDALRASILNLVLSEELEARLQNQIPVVIPQPSLLLSKTRFRERRPGLSSAPNDLLDITQSAALAGSAPISLPRDRLAVYVAFSGPAEAQKGGFNNLAGGNGGGGGGGEGEMKQRVAQQREAHRGNLSLIGLG